MSIRLARLMKRLTDLRMLIQRNAQTLAQYQRDVAKWGAELYGGQGGDAVRSRILQELRKAEGNLKSAETMSQSLLGQEAALLEQIAQEKARDWIEELARRSRDAWEQWQKRGGWRDRLVQLGSRALDAGKRFIRWVRPHPGLIVLALLGLGIYLAATKLREMQAAQYARILAQSSTDEDEEETEPPMVSGGPVTDLAPPSLVASEPAADLEFVNLQSLTGGFVIPGFDRDALVTLDLEQSGMSLSGTLSLSGPRFGLEEGDYDVSATIQEEASSSGRRTYWKFVVTIEQSVFKFSTEAGEIRLIEASVTRPDGPYLGEMLQLVRRDAPPFGMPPRND